ncbi:MAG: TetR/AcrR family transcriptional regulator [Flavipsychrobacter sp.]
MAKTELKDDRRTQKTKKLLAEALRILILEKGYDAVTIQDIIDTANIGRSTFYAHYENKDQLLIGNINFQMALIHTPGDDAENYPMGVNIRYLFEHTKEQMNLVKALYRSRSIDVVMNYFAEICASKIIEYNKRKIKSSKAAQKKLQYEAEAAAGGIVRVLLKWLEGDAVTPVDEMVAFAKRIMDSVVSVEQ